MADDQSGNPKKDGGLRRHGIEVPLPPERAETLAAMRDKSSEALALTPPMLEFRFRNGDSMALAYSYLMSVERNLSEGIRLTYSTHAISITGQNLDSVHKSILWQRIHIVTESDRSTASDSNTKGTHIECISVSMVA